MTEKLYKIYQKYALALARLYPSQHEQLVKALERFDRGQNVKIDDAYVKLAYDMIICDLMYQRQQEKD